MHLVQYTCAIAVHNLDDEYDTVLGNINMTLEVDLNVVEIDDEEYAQVNGSRIQWVYPQNITIEEGDFLWTEIETDYYYSNYIPMSISRWVNKSVFLNDGLQLATFNVTFEDLLDPHFAPSLWITAEERTDVNASLLMDTFATDAPIIEEHSIMDDEHRMKICLDPWLIELNKTYNFSVMVKADLNESSCSSVEYKPRFSTTIGSWNHEYPETSTFTAIMPGNLLPEHVHYASVSTNISNEWSYGSSFQQSMILKEIHNSEPLGPKSEIHVHKKEYLSTNDTYIDHTQIYNYTTGWNANVWDVENLDNVTYTITTSENFTYIDNWEIYPNGTENSFILPPTVEGQNYTWLLPLKDRIGSEINFVLDSSQTVQDNPWADMDVSTTDENGYTRVNITFTPIIPLDWINFRVGGDQIIDVSEYPPEFEIDMTSTSSYVRFDSGDITQDHIYNFSVLWDNPKKVNLWLEATFDWVEEPSSGAITLPVAELGSVTVKADVPVIWEHRPTLPQYVQSITINMSGWLTTPQKGDLNGDKEITPTDAAIALHIAVGSRPFDDAADVSGDRRVTSLDALMILQASNRVIDL